MLLVVLLSLLIVPIVVGVRLLGLVPTAVRLLSCLAFAFAFGTLGLIVSVPSASAFGVAFAFGFGLGRVLVGGVSVRGVLGGPFPG